MPLLQIRFVLVSYPAAAARPPDSALRSISPLMTVGYLRRQAWSCLQSHLPPSPNGDGIGYDSLRLVSSGIVLNDDLKLLQEYLRPPPATNAVFVAFKPPHTGTLPQLHLSAQSSRDTRGAAGFNAVGDDDAGGGAVDADADAEGEFFCRICHGDGPLADFIQPCSCSGSMRNVHAACLARWRSVSTNAAARSQCEQCHRHYSITQAWWVPLVMARSLILTVHSILLALAVAAIGLLLVPCTDSILSLLLLPPDSDFKLLLSGVFGLGAVSFCHLVHMRFSWMFFRGGVLHINWHSLLMTLMPLLALQDMTIRVVIALGFLHAVAHGYSKLRSVTMRYCLLPQQQHRFCVLNIALAQVLQRARRAHSQCVNGCVAP